MSIGAALWINQSLKNSANVDRSGEWMKVTDVNRAVQKENRNTKHWDIKDLIWKARSNAILS